jgi:uncharacterized protein YutE (UPF0331/DUF86 family)
VALVEKRRALDLLVALNGALEDLKRYRAITTPDELRTDHDRQHMVLHALLVAIQAAIDLAHLLVADRGSRRPETYREAFEILEDYNAIGAGLAERLSDLAGFRNVLVHGYYRLDLERVHSLLVDQSLALEEFARIVADEAG